MAAANDGLIGVVSVQMKPAAAEDLCENGRPELLLPDQRHLRYLH